MKSSRALLIAGGVSVPLLAGAALIGRAAHSQPPGGGPQFRGQRAAGNGSYKHECSIELKDGYRYITSNGIPDHATGQFPNRGNPNSISPQSYRFRVTMSPKIVNTDTRTRIFGVAVNGVPFDPGTAELWNNDFRWHYEALSGLLGARGGLGVDENFAHVQPTGAYHYHGLPMGLLKRLDYTHKMALVGYAADGFPIYGPYAYSNPEDPHSSLKMLKASYRIKNGSRPGGGNGAGGAYDGSFAQDYEYAKSVGDLDTCNGRHGVTPEFPKGTYYYVLTDNWPFVPRQVKGRPDASFSQGGPGGPGGRGPGGFAGPGGQGPGGPGGFGGPGGGQDPGGFGGPGGQGPGGPGGFGQGGPGFGPGGQRPGGAPNMAPIDGLGKYLSLNKAQQVKLDRWMKVVSALRAARFAMPAFAELKLTDAQIERIAGGAKFPDILTAIQKRILESNRMLGFGPGGPGGGPGFGPRGGQGGPGGPPPGQ